MIKFYRLSSWTSILRRAGLAFACIASAGIGIASATVPVVQGRWEFVVTTGDTDSQLASMGQSIFSTYLLQTTPGSPVLTNIPQFTVDTVACDTQSYNNVTVTGTSFDAQGNVVVDFMVTLDGGTSFHYVFTGVLTQGPPGPPKVITGTYQRSADSCNQGHLGTATTDGTFTATWFPDLSGTWVGAFDAPDVGTGPTAVSASFTLTTNSPDETLSGTINIIGAGLVDSHGTACIANPITLQPNMAEGISQSSGAGFELFGIDANGTRVWVNAMATNFDGSIAAVGEDNPTDGSDGTANDGTNKAYTAFYGITGGPCDGFGGGDAPFLLVTKTKKESKRQDGEHGHDGQRGPRGRNNPAVRSTER